MNQNDRDRLARWMGWWQHPLCSAWITPVGNGWESGIRIDTWLNPPTWEQAGMLLERLRELGYAYRLQGLPDHIMCNILGPAKAGSAVFVDIPETICFHKAEAEAIAAAVLAMIEAQEAGE